MTVAEMLQVQEVDVVTQDDILLAERMELDEQDLRALSITSVHYLGNIMLEGEQPHPAIRVHCGPEDAIKRGGTKFKLYEEVDAWYDDGLAHGKAMRDKIGAIGEVDYAGGKTVVNIDPNPRGLSVATKHHRITEALDQLAGLVNDAGLADPHKDGTTGDEGTNAEIGRAYLRGLGRRGVPNYEACVTGKPDMRTRPAATGRGAAISIRTSMRIEGDDERTLVIQGAGFAGAYLAAEAYRPYDPLDEDAVIKVAAIGDLDGNKQPVTLTTRDPEGLPITRDMVDAVLLDPTDRHVQAANGDKIGAFALKLEERGANVEIVSQDVLFFDPQGRKNVSLAPAATSGAINPGNIDSIKISDWEEIGNKTVKGISSDELKERGIRKKPGHLRNAGGVEMSIQENRRDLDRINAERNGGLYLPVSDHEYEGRLHTTMTQATLQAHRVAEQYGVGLTTATKMVALGQYAMAHNMHISSTMRNLLMAA